MPRPSSDFGLFEENPPLCCAENGKWLLIGAVGVDGGEIFEEKGAAFKAEALLNRLAIFGSDPAIVGVFGGDPDPDVVEVLLFFPTRPPPP